MPINEELEGINDDNLVIDGAFIDTELVRGNVMVVACKDRFGISLGCSVECEEGLLLDILYR